MPKSTGFTLIEVLIAMAIFAVISAMTFQGLQTSMMVQQNVEEKSATLNDIQLVMTLLLDDFLNVTRRPILPAFGEERLPAFQEETNEYTRDDSYYCEVSFSRAGVEPGGLIRSGLYRVSYCQQEDRLYRLSWPVLDRSQDSQPVVSVLLENVVSFDIQPYWSVVREKDQNSRAYLESLPTDEGDEGTGIEVELVLRDQNDNERTFSRRFPGLGEYPWRLAD
ncbi:MAG: type II secretion system minor pseudopilin GspJ [Chromatiales bacterium]|nr:type II secretion system minor pseudopilin GspJ [Chromatiales bacterium]